MIDSKAVMQEVQDQLLAIVHRGQEQVRKGQERVHKSQEQVRKGREVVSGAVRTGTELAKAVRPSAPALKSLPSPADVRARAQELAGHAVSAQRKARHAATPYAEQALATQRNLAGKARHAAIPYTEQVLAAQRSLTGKVIEVAKVATPFVAEGRARLNQVVGTLQDARRPGRATTAEPTADEQAERLVTEPVADATTAPKAAKPRARSAKADGAKTGAGKSGAGTSTTAKPRTAKAASAKPGASTSRTVKK
jgi:hypothetical protein